MQAVQANLSASFPCYWVGIHPACSLPGDWQKPLVFASKIWQTEFWGAACILISQRVKLPALGDGHISSSTLDWLSYTRGAEFIISVGKKASLRKINKKNESWPNWVLHIIKLKMMNCCSWGNKAKLWHITPSAGIRSALRGCTPPHSRKHQGCRALHPSLSATSSVLAALSSWEL